MAKITSFCIGFSDWSLYLKLEISLAIFRCPKQLMTNIDSFLFDNGCMLMIFLQKMGLWISRLAVNLFGRNVQTRIIMLGLDNAGI